MKNLMMVILGVTLHAHVGLSCFAEDGESELSVLKVPVDNSLHVLVPLNLFTEEHLNEMKELAKHDGFSLEEYSRNDSREEHVTWNEIHTTNQFSAQKQWLQQFAPYFPTKRLITTASISLSGDRMTFHDHSVGSYDAVVFLGKSNKNKRQVAHPDLFKSRVERENKRSEILRTWGDRGPSTLKKQLKKSDCDFDSTPLLFGGKHRLGDFSLIVLLSLLLEQKDAQEARLAAAEQKKYAESVRRKFVEHGIFAKLKKPLITNTD